MSKLTVATPQSLLPTQTFHELSIGDVVYCPKYETNCLKTNSLTFLVLNNFLSHTVEEDFKVINSKSATLVVKY